MKITKEEKLLNYIDGLERMLKDLKEQGNLRKCSEVSMQLATIENTLEILEIEIDGFNA